MLNQQPNNAEVTELFYGIDFGNNLKSLESKSKLETKVTHRFDPTTGILTKRIDFIPRDNKYLDYYLENIEFYCEIVTFNDYDYNTVYLYLFPEKDDYENLKKHIHLVLSKKGAKKIFEENQYLWYEVKLDSFNIVRFTPYEDYNSLLLNWGVKITTK